MPEETQEYIQNHWHTIQKTVPGTEFNFEFWEKCNPRRSTCLACRAIIAARNQGDEYDDKMNLAIQQGYYLQARNPSDNETLVALADEIGLDSNRFVHDLETAETHAILESEIQFTRKIGVDAFSSSILEHHQTCDRININYLHPNLMLDDLSSCFY